MIFWVDTQLPPNLADWLRWTFKVEAYAPGRRKPKITGTNNWVIGRRADAIRRSANPIVTIRQNRDAFRLTALAGWIRTTWLPYTQRLAEELRESFIEAVCSSYLDQVPLSEDGKAHVAMVLLEVEAEKLAKR